MLVNLIDEQGVQQTTLPDGSRHVESFRFGPELERQYLGPNNRLPPANLIVDQLRVPITQVSFKDPAMIPDNLTLDRRDNNLYVAVVGHSRFVVQLQEAVLASERETHRGALRLEHSKRRELEKYIKTVRSYAREARAAALAERKKWVVLLVVSNLLTALAPIVWYELL